MDAALALSIGKILQAWALPLEHLGRTADGSFLIFAPESKAEAMAGRLEILTRWIVRTNFTSADEGVRVTPICGYAEALPDDTAQALRNRARIAMAHAGAHLDLRPIPLRPRHGGDRRARPRASRRASAPRWSLCACRCRSS